MTDLGEVSRPAQAVISDEAIQFLLCGFWIASLRSQ
jgi:hypothetical protein